MFNALYSRTLDLVGDYAGDELFIIEGDSLLLHCLSEDQLDFSPGFQLLHATYLVERFLAQLYQRKCNFHIVFFAQHAEACVPPHAAADDKSKYLLAREAILQHLTEHLPRVASSIQVRSFDAYECSDFRGYLSSVGAYFLMCHDGAFSGLQPLKDESSEDEDEDEGEEYYVSPGEPIVDVASPIRHTSILLRKMILWFVSNGYNIALISMLECRDTKVMATILEGSARAARQVYSTVEDEPLDVRHPSAAYTRQSENLVTAGNISPASSILKIPSDNPSSKSPKLYAVLDEVSDALVGILKETDLHLSQRELAVALTISAMLKSTRSSGDDIIPTRAMILHIAMISECRIDKRSTSTTSSSRGLLFLRRFVKILFQTMRSPSWQRLIRSKSTVCDVADMLDGRLFLQTFDFLAHCNEPSNISASVVGRCDELASLVKRICDVNLKYELPVDALSPDNRSQESSLWSDNGVASQSLSLKNITGNLDDLSTVLPFSNPIMNPHLDPISLAVDKSSESELDSGTPRTFQELSHWHNHKRPLDNKTKAPMSARQLAFMYRRDQWFMAEIRNYAESLTNPTGGILQPESVFLKTMQARNENPSKNTSAHLSQKQASIKKVSTQRLGKSKSGGPASRAQAEAYHQTKQAKTHEKYFNAWKSSLATFEKESNYTKRYLKVTLYLKSLSMEKRKVVEPEVLTYIIHILVNLWIGECNANRKANSLHIVALIWHTVLQIRNRQDVTEIIAKCVNDTIKALRLPAIDVQSDFQRSLSFSFVSLSSQKRNLSIGISPTEFQLTHAGPYLDRSMGSAPDPRVHEFEPDQWQREILDQIDARKSLFVVAPTSAGKTFISFYAMKQVLEESDEGVLVYVAPTKALVNQIAAEVQARFSKTFSHGAGKSVWAIHTRDYRINNCTGCQILITVPHILQIMLLSPSNAKTWSSRVKRIIFDEIHSIGQADDGVVWEQLLLLAPCPIIALSATVGNPQAFSNWLSLTQKANENELKMIEHKTRYSDLRKYVYNPPSEFLFNGLSAPTHLASLGLDDSPHMIFMHPVASLIDRSRGMPDDLTLEPRDCLALWNSMEKHKTEDFPLDDALRPSVALPNFAAKADVIRWEASLKATLTSWMKDSESPFDRVLNELSINLHNSIRSPLQKSSTKTQDSGTARTVRASSLLDSTLPLICSLHDQGALPAIFFNYDRSWCEKLCKHILTELQEAEECWKASSPVWEKWIAGWEAWKKTEEKRAKVKPPKGKQSSNDEEGRLSRTERMQESASVESSPYDSFDPDEPLSGFHLADMKCLPRSEFDSYAKELRRRSIPEWLIDGLKRGIGVHHSGLNRKYRQVCEILFRKGYLRVVIATGTLALGINMPCKTVVFSGDSVFLTALGFRQAAGRAGRRGFDFLGNVVFQGIAYPKVCRLLSSKLPDLNGHFPITTSLVLRLFILLIESGQAPFAVKAINSVLSCPRIYLGGPEAKHTVLHHLRFSIEYLRRNYLLDQSGSPLNFAGTISHLYYTENSSFAFHALLSKGYFHQLCEDVYRNPEVVTRTLMLVMAHIFGRRYLPRKTIEFHKSADKHSPSVVFLPPLPKGAAKAIRAHNKSTLDIYAAYVTTFIKQHIKKADCTLPLTRLKQGGDKSPAELCPALPVLPPTLVNSPFVALSGHRDTWTSISQLCKMVRSGVWLEQSVVPYVAIGPEEDHAPLNAYLYDFFRHGNVQALETGNMIRKGDIWFVLNDFSLVLATVVTSLENFLKFAPNTDTDMLDVQGSGDAYDEELDKRAMEAGDSSSDVLSESHQKASHRKNQSGGGSAVTAPVKAKKSKVSENWDDELSDEETSENPELDISSSPGITGQSNGRTTASNSEMSGTQHEVLEEQRLLKVLTGFRLLQSEFNGKFKAMWA
ncbi:DEAD/DEAH box helicase [Aspergillus steynii IBT 23096]|uniref:DEAD/DEAH box helicase n=1 Tax=Aspergillus steynii IBT 23096 TaxID=1392250 RepID=A0A2I2FWK2_9EURO|nr:DEAD/DEAH box helicase [Aspergillus steynii IBT 23096]PLB45008.1 DEAD/DEAH box helicase [Aspergillus steynii IBT 23096]